MNQQYLLVGEVIRQGTTSQYFRIYKAFTKPQYKLLDTASWISSTRKRKSCRSLTVITSLL